MAFWTSDSFERAPNFIHSATILPPASDVAIARMGGMREKLYTLAEAAKKIGCHRSTTKRQAEAIDRGGSYKTGQDYSPAAGESEEKQTEVKPNGQNREATMAAQLQTGVTVIHGDCLDVLRRMPAKSVDLVFTSPPYPLKTERYIAHRRSSPGAMVGVDGGSRRECCRVCSGFVCVVAKCYLAQEFRAQQAGPWWVNDWEPVMAFYSGERPTT